MKQKLKNFLQRFIFPIVYKIGSLQRVESGLILLADSHNEECPESMLILREELLRRGFNVKERYHNFSQLGEFISLFVSLKTILIAAKSEVIILCDNYHAIDSFWRREETTIIQLWHGSGSYKKFGYDTEFSNLSLKKEHKLYRYDIVTTSSKFSRKNFSTAMKLSEDKVLPIGLSRTDKFFDKAWTKKTQTLIYKDYPELKGRKIILWTPTFRTLNDANTPIGSEEILELETYLGPNYKVITKLHPHIQIDDKFNKYSSTQLMTITDLLITDYSSIIFDWMLLSDKAILFMPDYKTYSQSVGFYVDPKEFPFPSATDIESLICTVEFVLNEGIKEKEFLRFKEKMIGSCDGRSTERIINLIEKNIGGN